VRIKPSGASRALKPETAAAHIAFTLVSSSVRKASVEVNVTVGFEDFVKCNVDDVGAGGDRLHKVFGAVLQHASVARRKFQLLDVSLETTPPSTPVVCFDRSMHCQQFPVNSPAW